MDIDYLRMKNFRQYRDAKIEFAHSPDRNFTIVEGVMGAGKTNILNALTWCLFGEELHIDEKYAGLPRINTTALSENSNGISELVVEVQFIQSDGKKIRVTRTGHFKEDKGNLKTIVSARDLCIMRETGREWVGPIYGDDAQYIVDSLIPPSIEEYFFFDGERMDDYFRQNTGKDIKKAVFKISQLQLCESMIEHLAARKTEYLRQARGLSPKAQEKKEMIELQERTQKSDKARLEELQTKFGEAEQMEKEFSEKLRNSSPERIQSLEEQRVSLEKDLNRIKEEIEDYESSRVKLLHKSMPTIFAYEALLKTKNLIEGRKEAGMIPPPMKTVFIDSLLKKGKCICGSDITKKDEYSSARRKRVEALLKQSALSEMSNELIDCNVHIQEMIDQAPAFPDEIIDIGKELKEAQTIKDEKNKELEKISTEIAQSNSENVKLWGKERDKYTKEKTELSVEIGIIKRNMERRGNLIRVQNSELKRELGKEKKHDSLRRLMDFCDEGIKAAQSVRDSIMSNVREEVARKTSQQFLALIWKKETYEGVNIDDDYNISVPHVSGREALGTLSAGERQVCALSFMAALNSVSGFDVPIVIDTPLARISTGPTKNIAENLPSYLSGKQVTLLVTDKEYTPDVRDALSKVVGKTYMINFVEKGYGGLAEVELQQ
jgi:DNA sulfur modification protein DndD